ncbi:MAG: hypothetical protein CM1200mP2_48540 [Planctomycetaceae bacterium]|nr:MAG: hypothetical protein CM1200mP2_48540 [Planctomycetaceae bacterium]
MPIPVSQMWTVARYVMGQRLRGRRRFPLVLMLEPLFRCNLACAGCGKIQHPTEVLRQHLSPAQCFEAAEECGAPIVSIPEGNPFCTPTSSRLSRSDRPRKVRLSLHQCLCSKRPATIHPLEAMTFSVHLDGPAEEHDTAVCRDGVYDVAESAIVAAIAGGFRVTTNTTVFNTPNPIVSPLF